MKQYKAEKLDVILEDVADGLRPLFDNLKVGVGVGAIVARRRFGMKGADTLTLHLACVYVQYRIDTAIATHERLM